MVDDFQIYQIWAHHFRTSPTLLDNLRQFLRDIVAVFVIPVVVKPVMKFVGGILLQYINVEFAVLLQACSGQIAATDKAHQGRDCVSAVDLV